MVRFQPPRPDLDAVPPASARRGAVHAQGGVLATSAGRVQRSLLIVLAALASPAAAAAQTAEPARAPRFLVAGSVSSDFGGADVRSAGEYWTVGPQATWLPVSWLGLTADVYEVVLFPYGLGFGARAGPTLRW